MFRFSLLRTRDLIAGFYCPVCKTGFDDRLTLAIHIRKRH